MAQPTAEAVSDKKMKGFQKVLLLLQGKENTPDYRVINYNVFLINRAINNFLFFN